MGRSILWSIIGGLLALYVGAAAAAAAPVSAGPGSCRGVDFSAYYDHSGVFDPDGRLALYLRDGVPLYDQAVDGTVIGRGRFSDAVRIIGAGVSRLQVRAIGATVASGWVDRGDLLCRLKPLRDPNTGLERKAFIRTETTLAEEGKGATVTAYPAPDLTGCGPGECRLLSRFELYFVMDETADAILLSDTFVIDGPQVRLVGWINRRDAIPWNWALGLRPAETLAHEGGVGSVCAYVSAADAKSGTDCQPILGGPGWFKSWYRLPIIEATDGFYKVAVPGAAIDGKNVVAQAGSRLTMIDPTAVRQIPDSQIQARNRVDVFFLIDGSRSMQPWIDAIRGTAEQPGVVQAIIEALRRQIAEGASLRFGFRVYRDSVARGGDGIGEGLALPGENCREPDEIGADDNRKAFLTGLRAVAVTADDRDDYPENTFGGLMQALRDVRGCEDNTKVVFVIGDAGYNAARQILRGHDAVEVEDIAKRINARSAMALFFVRPPSDPGDAKRPERYDRAWKQFRDQGLEILTALDSQKDDAAAYLIDLPQGGRADAAILDRIVERVRALTRPDLISEIQVDLRGGAALAEIVARLKRTNGDVPALFWKLVEKSACRELDDLCRTRIYESIGEVYVPISDEVVEEIWLRADDLLNWQTILRPLREVDMKGADRRRSLVTALVSSLENTLHEPPFQETGESFAEYVRRAGGLPMRSLSPLLAYSPDEILNPDRVPACEIDFLTLWARRSGEMLSVAYDGRFRPVWQHTNPGIPPEVCPGASPKARALPFIASAIDRKPLGPDDSYNYSTAFRKATVYWIPQDFLP